MLDIKKFKWICQLTIKVDRDLEHLKEKNAGIFTIINRETEPNLFKRLNNHTRRLYNGGKRRLYLDDIKCYIIQKRFILNGQLISEYDNIILVLETRSAEEAFCALVGYLLNET